MQKLKHALEKVPTPNVYEVNRNESYGQILEKKSDIIPFVYK